VNGECPIQSWEAANQSRFPHQTGIPQNSGIGGNSKSHLLKHSSRREMLRESATLDGSVFLAHLFPRGFRASAAGYAQQGIRIVFAATNPTLTASL
jgi:hypothetical protein